MTDRFAIERNIWAPNSDHDAEPIKVRMRDMGDGTFAYPMVDATAEGLMVTVSKRQSNIEALLLAILNQLRNGVKTKENLVSIDIVGVPTLIEI